MNNDPFYKKTIPDDERAYEDFKEWFALQNFEHGSLLQLNAYIYKSGWLKRNEDCKESIQIHSNIILKQCETIEKLENELEEAYKTIAAYDGTIQ